MPAIASRIGFIMSEFRRAISTTQAAQDRFGSAARQTADPIETYFDRVQDAQVMADERQALLSAERRRFKTTVKGVEEVLALDLSAGIPAAQYVDTERGADRTVLISEIVIDLDRQNTTMTVWG